MLRIAVFGCGYWAAFQVAAWQAQGAQVVAVWNRTRAKADAFAEKFSIPNVFDTPEEVYDWGGFDIADIIADAPAHEELTLLAAKRGKAVICQKPMAPTLEACRRMVEGCAAAGVWYAVHENFRYQPPTVAFIEAVRSGVIGKVLHASIAMRSPDLAIMEKQPALKVMPHMVLRDMGPHIFDVARAAFGEMDSIYAVPVYSYEGIDVPDATTGIVLSSSSAERQRIQRLGRVIRRSPGKNAACLYYVYIRESADDRTFLPDFERCRCFDLEFDTAARCFRNDFYEYAGNELLDKLKTEKPGRQEMEETRRCLLEGLPRADYLLDREIQKQNAILAKTKKEKNYWTVMQSIGRYF